MEIGYLGCVWVVDWGLELETLTLAFSINSQHDMLTQQMVYYWTKCQNHGLDLTSTDSETIPDPPWHAN